MSLALVIATFVGEGEREGVMVVSPAIAFYVPAFDKIVGNVAADFMVAGLILSMNTATMDGSRAVRGLTRRDDAQELGVLNSRHVSARAVTVGLGGKSPGPVQVTCLGAGGSISKRGRRPIKRVPGDHLI